MNSIMMSDEASKESEFLSALNASLESFDHKTFTFKNHEIECFHRIVCHGRYCFGCATDGIRQGGHISVNSNSVVSYG